MDETLLEAKGSETVLSAAGKKHFEGEMSGSWGRGVEGEGRRRKETASLHASCRCLVYRNRLLDGHKVIHLPLSIDDIGY